MSVLTLAAALLAPGLPQEGPPAVFERSGAHYRVRCEFGSEDLAEQALAAAEAAWPLALAALGVKERKLPELLVVHLYPDQASYRAAAGPLTNGALEASLSCAHFATKSAHIALQPPCSAAALRELGLPTLTRYQVAHEACHLALYATLPNALAQPEWFAEGLAQEVGSRALIDLGLAQGIDDEPYSARSAVLCQELAAKNRLPGVDEFFSDRVGKLELAPRHALYRLFYEFLRTEEEKNLKKAAAAIARLDKGERSDLDSALDPLSSKKSREGLDPRFLAYVRARKPLWNELTRSLETRGTELVQRGWPELSAFAFRSEALTTLPITAAGVLRVLPGETHQMNFLLGRDTTGFLSVAFLVGESVSLFRQDSAGNKWTLLATAPARGTRVGQDIPFRIQAGADELVVTLGNKEGLRAKLAGRTPLGQWGLGAQDGTTGVWKTLAVKAGP